MPSLVRVLGGALIGLLAALALASVALAGGWSVVVLDEASALVGKSGDVRAGTAFSIGFTVLQHGRHPVDGLAPRITLTPAGGGDPVLFTAEAEGGPGHYMAALTLPAAGRWTWQIDAFGPPAVMSPLEVAPPAPQPAAPAPLPVALPWAALAAGVVVAGLLALRLRGGRAAVAR